MAYIKITSKCNMRCEHCCYSCTMDGQDMSMETFKQTLEICTDLGEYTTLGGGEPTLHPHFWEIFGLSIGSSYGTYIITNGSQTEIALKLLRIAQNCEELFGVELSVDCYHDPIDYKVEEAYKKAGRTRNVAERICYAGRAKDYWSNNECISSCVCEDWVVEPDGTIRFCGCDDSPIVGNVFTGIKEEYLEYRNEDRCYCHNDINKIEKDDAA